MIQWDHSISIYAYNLIIDIFASISNQVDLKISEQLLDYASAPR